MSVGYITYEQLNTVLPPDQVSSEQIEDVMSMLSEMGINVIENDEADEAEPSGRTGRNLVHLSRSRRCSDRPLQKRLIAPTIRSACTLREMGSR